MGVPTSEVSYTSATTVRGGHEVHKGHVVALEKNHLRLKGFRFNGVKFTNTCCALVRYDTLLYRSLQEVCSFEYLYQNQWLSSLWGRWSPWLLNSTLCSYRSYSLEWLISFLITTIRLCSDILTYVSDYNTVWTQNTRVCVCVCFMYMYIYIYIYI
jgi:hypothetical protein